MAWDASTISRLLSSELKLRRKAGIWRRGKAGSTLDLARAFFFGGSSTSDDISESLFCDGRHSTPRSTMEVRMYLVVRHSAR